MPWFFPESNGKPDLDYESFTIFMKLLSEKRYSARNNSDMESLRERLHSEGKSTKLVDAVVWRFYNLLCDDRP